MFFVVNNNKNHIVIIYRIQIWSKIIYSYDKTNEYMRFIWIKYK